MNDWWQIFLVFIISTIKFVFGGIPTALGLGFPFFKAVTITSLGGFTGTVIFTFLSEKIISNYKKRVIRRRITHPHLTPKKVFTRRKRFIVSIKRRFGLLGIAFFTPLLFSIPLGCFIAVRYYKSKQTILIYMFTSVLMWSATAYYMYFPIIAALKKLF